MPDDESLKDVPQDKLGETVQEFADLSEATQILCVKQPNGKWAVADQTSG